MRVPVTPHHHQHLKNFFAKVFTFLILFGFMIKSNVTLLEFVPAFDTR